MGAEFARRLPAALRRPALVHRRRHEPLGLAVLVGEHERVLRQPDAGQPARADGPAVQALLGHVRRRGARRAPAMGQSGYLDSGDDLLQRTGDAAGRHRPRTAGPDAGAQALRPAVGAIRLVRREQEPAQQPLELPRRRDRGRRATTSSRQGRGHLRAHVAHPRRRGARGAISPGSATSSPRDEAWLRDRAYPLIKRRGRVLPALSRTCRRTRAASTTSITPTAANRPGTRDDARLRSHVHAHDLPAGGARRGDSRRRRRPLRPAWREIKAHLVAAPANSLCGTGSVAAGRPTARLSTTVPARSSRSAREPELKQPLPRIHAPRAASSTRPAAAARRFSATGCACAKARARSTPSTSPA